MKAFPQKKGLSRTWMVFATHGNSLHECSPGIYAHSSPQLAIFFFLPHHPKYLIAFSRLRYRCSHRLGIAGSPFSPVLNPLPLIPPLGEAH